MPDAAGMLAHRVVEAMLQADHATKSSGIHVVGVDAGVATVEMTVRGDVLNGHRICHSGILFTLADTAFAFACNSRNRRTLERHAKSSVGIGVTVMLTAPVMLAWPPGKARHVIDRRSTEPGSNYQPISAGRLD